MMFFDPMYFLYIAPALLLGLWAQMRVKSTFAVAHRMPAPLSGAAAARHILDSAGLRNVEIERVPGQLTDHYDPRHKILRLSQDIYQQRSLAAVGIAAHEAGHALQDAKNYAPLVIRNLAVPVAGFGSNASLILILIGMLFTPLKFLVLVGILLFSCFVLFQVINLPVEFNASSRAKAQLVELGIVSTDQLVYVKKVLDAAAWTYVAGTLQAIMVLLYYIMRLSGSRD
ncbi:MAG: zinc metallopeptidase [Pirellulales bacterium]|nr:zinc metallopeptidase [Pirellulales bacterium]